MFVRKKKNRSGTVTILVIDKSHGRFREVHHLGTSSDAHEIDKLEKEARKWNFKNVGQPVLRDNVLRDLAIARVCEPRSKLATVDYMRRYWGQDYHYQQVYRYLDTLYDSLQQAYQIFFHSLRFQ